MKPAMPFLLGMLHDNAKLQLSGPYNPFAGIPTSPGEEAVAPLTVALSDKNRHVRKSAAIGLGETGQPSAVSPLLALIESEPYSDVLTAAIHALGHIPIPQVIEPLIAALQEKDWTVREEASAACRNIKDIRVVGPLLQLLKVARANNKSGIVNNVESALGDLTTIYGADKDKEWQEWWTVNSPKTK